MEETCFNVQPQCIEKGSVMIDVLEDVDRRKLRSSQRVVREAD